MNVLLWPISGDPPMADTMQTVRILRIVEHGEGLKSFWVPAIFNIEPGQFITLWLPKVDEKPFAVSGSAEGELEITIKAVGPFTRSIMNCRPGDWVGIRGPFGKGFSLKNGAVLVGGGIGNAPLKFLAQRLSVAGMSYSWLAGGQSKADIRFLRYINPAETQNCSISTEEFFPRSSNNSKILPRSGRSRRSQESGERGKSENSGKLNLDESKLSLDELKPLDSPCSSHPRENVIGDFISIFESLHIFTDDGSEGRKGLVTDGLAEVFSGVFPLPEASPGADAGKRMDGGAGGRGLPGSVPTFICGSGPEPMLLATRQFALSRGIPVELSFERYMKCGIGLCGQCCLDGTGIRLCVEGPVLTEKQMAGVTEFRLSHRSSSGRRAIRNTTEAPKVTELTERKI